MTALALKKDDIFSGFHRKLSILTHLRHMLESGEDQSNFGAEADYIPVPNPDKIAS